MVYNNSVRNSRYITPVLKEVKVCLAVANSTSNCLFYNLLFSTLSCNNSLTSYDSHNCASKLWQTAFAARSASAAKPPQRPKVT